MENLWVPGLAQHGQIRISLRKYLATWYMSKWGEEGQVQHKIKQISWRRFKATEASMINMTVCALSSADTNIPKRSWYPNKTRNTPNLCSSCQVLLFKCLILSSTHLEHPRCRRSQRGFLEIEIRRLHRALILVIYHSSWVFWEFLPLNQGIPTRFDNQGKHDAARGLHGDPEGPKNRSKTAEIFGQKKPWASSPRRSYKARFSWKNPI